MNQKKIKPKYIVIAFLILVSIAVLCVLISNIIVCSSSGRFIYERENIKDLPSDFDCILVLGAGVYSDGTPTPMLNDRLAVACEAYNARRSDRILMSGDHLYNHYDEPGAMKKFAIEHGIESKVIFLDHVGISTYDSIYRAVNIYGAEKILIVTQKYHLYRAIYLARSMSAEAYGVSANLRSYMFQPKYTVREWGARVKDFGFSVLQPKATYMGDKIDLSGDGDLTN